MENREQRIEFRKKTLKNLLVKLGAADLFDQSLEEIIRFNSVLDEETDRGCALMAAAYIESRIADLLKAFLVKDQDIFKELFNRFGPLAAFSARIDMAYILALISDSMRHDFHLIRKIRNEFAHTSSEISFDSPSISNRCHSFIFRLRSNVSPRLLYVDAVMGLDGAITAKLETTKNLKPILDPDMEERKLIAQKMIDLARADDE